MPVQSPPIAGPQGPIGPAGPAGVGSGPSIITVSPAYTNAGGQGARNSIIAISATSGLFVGNSYQQLVDGSTANNVTNSAAFTASFAATGSVITFDFGVGASKVITEATWAQSGSQSHGVWQWAGSNDGVTYSTIGATFTLGGSTSQVQTTLSANVTGYRYYRLQGVSGTTSAAPFVNEVTFKIGSTIIDGGALALAGGVAGQVPVSNGAASVWANPVGDPCAQLPGVASGGGLLASWSFGEGSGTTVADRMGKYPIDLTAPSSPGVAWTAKGVLATNGMVQTPVIASARTVALLYRVARGASGFIMSGGSGSGAGILGGQGYTAYTTYIGGGWDVHALSMNSGGLLGYETNRGGWMLMFVDLGASYSSAFGFGGRVGSTLYRNSVFEIAWAGAWNRVLTSGERSTVYSVARKLGQARGIYLNWQDCPGYVNVVGMWGESTMDGRSPIANLSAADQALRFSDTFIQTASTQLSANTFPRAHQFELGLNQQNTLPGTNFGFEFGVAYQNRASQKATLRDLYICKLGVGSTYLCPVGTTGSAGTTISSLDWSQADTTHISLYFNFLAQLYDLEQGLRLQGKGPYFAGLISAIGLNDANDTAYAVDATTYQGYLQAWYNQFQTDTGLVTPPMVVLQAHSPCTGANATALGYVRTAQAAFVSANTGCTLVNTDGYALLGDGVHFDASGSKAGGIAAFNALPALLA